MWFSQFIITSDVCFTEEFNISGFAQTKTRNRQTTEHQENRTDDSKNELKTGLTYKLNWCGAGGVRWRTTGERKNTRTTKNTKKLKWQEGWQISHFGELWIWYVHLKSHPAQRFSVFRWLLIWLGVRTFIFRISHRHSDESKRVKS